MKTVLKFHFLRGCQGRRNVLTDVLFSRIIHSYVVILLNENQKRLSTRSQQALLNITNVFENFVDESEQLLVQSLQFLKPISSFFVSEGALMGRRVDEAVNLKNNVHVA